MNTFTQAKSMLSYIRKLIKYFHSIPELAGYEKYTVRKITSELKKLKIEYEVIDNYSVIAYVNKNKSRKKIAFRTKIESIPISLKINKENDKIDNTLFQLRGHDVSISILLAVINILESKKTDLKGCIMFIFESGSDDKKAPQKIINSNYLDGVDYIYSLIPTFIYPYHTADINSTFSMLGSETIEIRWYGKSRSSSQAYMGEDPIRAAANFVDTISSDIASSIDPTKIALATVTKFQAGTYHNITANYCEVTVNIRFQNDIIKKEVYNLINKKINQVNEKFQVSSKTMKSFLFEPFYNNEEASFLAQESFKKINKQNKLNNTIRQLYSDSFYLYLKKYKGSLGVYGITLLNDNVTFPVANGLENYDVNQLKMGIAWHLQIIYDYLS